MLMMENVWMERRAGFLITGGGENQGGPSSSIKAHGLEKRSRVNKGENWSGGSFGRLRRLPHLRAEGDIALVLRPTMEGERATRRQRTHIRG